MTQTLSVPETAARDMGSGAHVGRTIATLAALTCTLPIDLAIVGLALAVRPVAPKRSPVGRTVLVSGGKMTKALQLARSLHEAGNRVVLVESAKYRLNAHRFSRAVDAFHCVPEPTDPGYGQALLDVVRREGVDVFIPVSSPVASIHDADARRLLDDVCEVIHADSEIVRLLDDKSEFSSLAQSFGLRVPDWHRITDPQQVVDFDFPDGRSYVLKRIAYNPVGRLDLTRLSGETPERNAAHARSLPISQDDPWIMQEFVTGREYCTHGTARHGKLTVYGCCESSASQLNYAMVDKPEIRSWVEAFVNRLGGTGQFSFDFMDSGDGVVYAIECNPRTHSAITMFYNHGDVAAAYLDDDHPTITPRRDARPTYWIYHELWRLLSQPDRRARLATILCGKDAVFSWRDPLPYLMLHHVQIPALLVDNLRRRGGWTKIDFNIGKLVEVGGD